MDPYTLVVIARTQSVAKRLRAELDAEQYLVRWVPSATQACDLDVCPSLLVLELPPTGGSRSTGWLKQRFDAPLLVLARDEQEPPDAVDVAVSKPYRLAHLAEVIEITLLENSPSIVRAGSLSLDQESCRLQFDGEIYQLRPLGCQILAELMNNAGTTVPRDDLFRRVWQTEDGDSTRALDVHISYLRRTIEPDPHNPTLILTERGVGYWLQPPE